MKLVTTMIVLTESSLLGKAASDHCYYTIQMVISMIAQLIMMVIITGITTTIVK